MGSPTLGGYTFTGWKITVGESGKEEAIPQDAIGSFIKDPNNTFTLSEEFIKTYIDDKNLTAESVTITFTATWKATEYTITYQVNEADDDDDHCTLSGGDENYTIESDTITLPTITPDKGYETENKWYFDEACTGEAVSSVDGKALFDRTSGANITLYAQVTAKTYKVEFAAECDGTEVEDVTFTSTASELTFGEAFNVGEAQKTDYKHISWDVRIGDENIVTGARVNYSFTLQANNLPDDNSDVTIRFVANLQMTVHSEIVEIDYTEDIAANITNFYNNGFKAKFKMLSPEGNDIKDKFTITFKSMTDGTHTYSAENTDAIFGGTYCVTLEITGFDNNSYVFDSSSITSAAESGQYNVYAKFKSVQIDSTWYTIEDALNTAQSDNTITVKYNTDFTSLEIANAVKYVGNDYYTVKNNVTLLLPYDGNTYYSNNSLEGSGSMSFGDISKRVVDLSVSDYVTLINRGSINIGGQTTGAQGISGSTAGKYASITLYDNAKIESYKNIDAYGFVIEASYDNGSELVMHEGQLRMPFIVVEHRGGTILFGAYANLQGSPFNQFFLHNVTAKLTIESKATLLGTANLHASSTNTTKDINLVGSDATYLIQLQSSDSKIVAKNDAREFISANANSVTRLDIIGNAALNSLSLTIDIVVTANLTTKGVYLPLSWYWNVTLKPNGTSESIVTATSQDIKILPGGSLKVDKNVTLKAGKIAVYTDAGFDDSVQAGIKYPDGKGDGALIVDGSLTAQVVGGLVETTAIGANLNVTLANRMNTYEMNTTNGKTTGAYADWKTLNHILQFKPYIDGDLGEITEQLSGKYVSKSVNGSFGWECVENGQAGKVRLNIIPEGESTITVKVGNQSLTNGTYYLDPNSVITYTISGATSNGSGWMGATNAGGNWSILGAGSLLGALSSSSSKSNPTVSNKSLTLPASGEVTIYARSWNGNDGACIVEGTLVTLADGTQKKVEDLQVGDMVLIFNHETGKYEAAPLLFNTHDGSDSTFVTVLYAMFSDGTELGIVGEHALFDVDLNRYIFLHAGNATKYIGHRFVKVVEENGKFVTHSLTMTNARIEEKCIKYYSPVSLFHLNVVTNNLLSYTAFVQNSEGFVNYFEYDDDMKFNEEAMQADIEKYGLYTYDDFKDIMTEDLFLVGPWKYFKVAVGKGQLTWADIMAELDFILHSGEV